MKLSDLRISCMRGVNRIGIVFIAIIIGHSIVTEGKTSNKWNVHQETTDWWSSMKMTCGEVGMNNEEWCKKNCPYSTDCACDGVCNFVLSLLKAQEPAWISVKDELPKSMANKVIVYLEHEDYVGYIGFGHYEKFRGEELWYDLENNAQFSKRGYTVTHWMPLPDPPKKGR